MHIDAGFKLLFVAMILILLPTSITSVLHQRKMRFTLRLRSTMQQHHHLQRASKSSHKLFFSNRNWNVVQTFWKSMVSSDERPRFVLGDEATGGFGVSNLKAVHEVGTCGEFKSKDLRYQRRKTYAMSVGYVGSSYKGFQRQKVADAPATVADDLFDSLQLQLTAAGRTDKDVSSISQIISFTTSGNETAQDFLDRVRSHISCQEGNLNAYECFRVPRKFNARSQATWRRYLYMFPLNGNDIVGYDVDTDFVNRCLSKIENLELPYSSLSYREMDRLNGSDEGLKDRCIMYRARASIVDLGDILPRMRYPEGGSSEEHMLEVKTLDEMGYELNNLQQQMDALKGHSAGDGDNDQAALSLAGKLNEKRDIISNRQSRFGLSSGAKVICIELVGNRFLRHMGTVVRESSLHHSERNENILVDICRTGDSARASMSAPGVGLGLSGVGFDLKELAVYRFMPKRDIEKIRSYAATETRGSIKDPE